MQYLKDYVIVYVIFKGLLGEEQSCFGLLKGRMSEGARDIANGIGYCEYLAGMATLLMSHILAKSHRS